MLRVKVMSIDSDQNELDYIINFDNFEQLCRFMENSKWIIEFYNNHDRKIDIKITQYQEWGEQ